MYFTKMQAYGNDYIYIPLLDQTLHSPDKWARFLSCPHFGIGSDGMVLIEHSNIADFKMRIFNPDGSEAEMCGNALRSTGMLVYEKGYTAKTDFTVETLGGIKRIYLDVVGGHVRNITAAIGAPILESEKIPSTASNADGFCLGVPIEALGQTFIINALSLGNPHCVVFVDDAFAFDINKYGPAIERHEVFPRRANVEFVEVVDSSNLRMRTWERNCGETLACATGCSAATVCGFLTGRIGPQATVHQLGGDILIKYDRNENCIYMTGKSTIVFDGTVNEDAIKEFDFYEVNKTIREHSVQR